MRKAAHGAVVHADMHHDVCTANSAGDHALTGLAIGKMLGIAGNNTVISGPEIDSMTDERLRGVSSCFCYQLQIQLLVRSKSSSTHAVESKSQDHT